MDNNFNWDVVIRLATQGAKGSADDLNKVAEAQDRLNREGKITEKGLEQNTRSLNRYSQSARAAQGNLASYGVSANAARYANYDLASSLLTVSAAFTALGVASVVAFASQERAFTEVERIASGSSSEIKGLRDELQALSTQIPVSFNELSKIASLGAALDIPSTALSKFTEVVAKFAAVTGTTVEAAAAGFGRLAAYFDLDPEQFDALGSAILRAGNISVATEEEVLKYAQALSIAGSRAGFTADQTIALAAGIASFGRINVEGAGSALSRITTQIDMATSEGGEKLENFAAVAGMSAAEFQTAWGADSFSAFQSLLRGLSGLDNANLVLKEIGINNERDSRTILALAQNYGKFNAILGETTTAWREGIYMNESYGLVLDDLNSKWVIFMNALTNAAAAVGATAAPALERLLQVTTDLLVGFSKFAESGMGQFLVQFAAGVLGLVAAWAALRGGLALATASALAFRTATSFLGGGGLARAVLGLATAMGIYKAGTDGATGSTIGLRVALTGLLRATVVLGIIQALGMALFDLKSAGDFVIDVFVGIARSVVAAGRIIADVIGMIPGAGVFKDWANGLQVAFDELENFRGDAHKEWGNFAQDMGWLTEETWGLGEALGSGSVAMDDLGESLESADIAGLGDDAAQAAEQVRTLVDYANDLASVWTRAFEIRFSSQTTLDAIQTSFQGIAEATENAQRAIRSLQAEISGLNSDINIQQRFLSVAIEYQDYDRAQAIQANLEKLQADLADKTAALSEEQAKNSKVLTGNSKAAIQNRTTITGLVQQYQAHIQALASSGMSQAELAVATERLRQDFIAQATQLGYNRGELMTYAAAFDDVAIAIANVPTNINVTANVHPALQALNEFEARARSAAANVQSALGGISMPSLGGNGVDDGYKYAADWRSGFRAYINKGGGIQFIDERGGRVATIQAFSGGGYTGPGGKYEPAGIVHRGEYVVPKQDVNQRTGLPYADALGRLQRGMAGRASYAGGGFVRPAASAPSGHIDSFGPMAQQQLMTALRQIVTLDGKVIAQNSAERYAQGTNEGSY